MADTKINSAGKRQPVDEKSRYAKMSASEMSKELAQDIDRKQVTLPKQEYAALCSALRTRFTSSIPPNGNILLGDFYYMFRYDSWSEKVACIFKVDIDTYKDYISDVEEIFGND